MTIPNQWLPILTALNTLALEDEILSKFMSTGWCGAPPASEVEIQAAETRLGQTLPPSYCSFLKITNGWQPYGSFVERLLPVAEINWLRLVESEDVSFLIQCWGQDWDISEEDYRDYANPNHAIAMRTSYYPDCLLIGHGGNGGEMIFLNPKTVSPDGEWEAIFFANWLPGHVRYRTFYDLVVRDLESERLIAAQK